MIEVLVVDDDFMVARIHTGFVERTPGFTVTGVAQLVRQRPDQLMRSLAPLLERGLVVVSEDRIVVPALAEAVSELVLRQARSAASSAAMLAELSSAVPHLVASTTRPDPRHVTEVQPLDGELSSGGNPLELLQLMLRTSRGDMLWLRPDAWAMPRESQVSELVGEAIASNWIAPLGPHVDAFERDHEVPVTFRRSGRARPLPSAATVALLGAVREALTNAAKHARGAPVTVTLDHTDTAVRVVVHNTTDTPVTRGTGFGLTGMAERLALCGGTLTAGPDTDGWSVTATVPTRLADESPKEAVSG